MARSSAALLIAILALAGCAAPATPSAVASAPPDPTPAPTLAPTPDGTPHPAGLTGEIAYVAGADPQIHLLDLATGATRPLTDLVPADADVTAGGPMRPALSCAFGVFGLAWSPDGSRLAFAYGGCDGVVHVVDAEGELERIGPGRGPSWSPDGRLVAYTPNVPWAPCGRECLPDDVGALELLVAAPGTGHPPQPFTAHGDRVIPYVAAWSPDGTAIGFGGSGSPLPDNPMGSAVYLVGADGSGERLVLDATGFNGWLPDGRMLVAPARAPHALFAHDLASGTTEDLGLAFGALPSTDGRHWIAFRTDPASGEGFVQLVGEGREPRYEAPGWLGAWAPGGGMFVHATSAPLPGPGELVVVDTDGREIGRYAVPDAPFALAWRPTGP